MDGRLSIICKAAQYEDCNTTCNTRNVDLYCVDFVAQSSSNCFVYHELYCPHGSVIWLGPESSGLVAPSCSCTNLTMLLFMKRIRIELNTIIV